MFSKYIDNRKEIGTDLIVQDFNFDKKAEMFEHYPRGYMGLDKQGRVIYFE